MINWVIGFIILLALYFALRSVLKTVKHGGCMGCGTCDHCGCNCETEKDKK
ncbi:MAG: FeoB-associated Cys-rich membrane protein [Phascolarctobacterium sp.]|nr:FeoB-associated Cys-rich membrane protein [Phascolarctobacterium sp.]